ncbi:MAG: hypothetical protein PHT79_10185 [Syntrophomonadaceae bacterium]|nr:hypothetical protein [Syntrophomonadaceae bacterium]MDD4550111.1 hypothetical protein [Syntrophomonadaceae bacterium]
MDVLNWKSKYVEPGICDGTQWSVEIVRDERNIKKYGDNKFPDEWDECLGDEKMNIINFIVIVMLLSVLTKQISYIRKLKIKTKKSFLEILTVVLGILVLITLTIFFAKHYMHFLIAFIGIILLVINWIKQGIFDSGILIVAKGKELYLWNEVRYAQINTGDIITIDYYSVSGSKIISHKFEMQNYDKILEIFEDNNIQFVIENPTK